MFVLEFSGLHRGEKSRVFQCSMLVFSQLDFCPLLVNLGLTTKPPEYWWFQVMGSVDTTTLLLHSPRTLLDSFISGLSNKPSFVGLCGVQLLLSTENDNESLPIYWFL